MKDKELVEETRRWLVEATAGYCRDHLNDEYQSLCEKLIDKMARKRTAPFLSGKMQIWAAAVVYAIGQINFLFDRASEPYATADGICDYFGVKKNTVSNKAREIRDTFKMHNWDKEFSTAAVGQRDPFRDMVMVNGFIVPKSMLRPEMPELLED